MTLWRKKSKSKTKDSKKPTYTDVPLHPTNCFVISKHGGFTQNIPIYDVTSSSDVKSYPENAAEKDDFEKWFTATRKASEDISSLDPILTIHRNKWYKHNFTGQVGDTTVATWHGGTFSGSQNKIQFPAGSEHCEHDITMKVDSVIKFRDEFTINSVLYKWECLKGSGYRQFQLYKILGSEKKAIARYWQPKMQFSQGGLVVVDENEVDVMVALMTAMVMVRKQRQKYGEHAAASG